MFLYFILVTVSYSAVKVSFVHQKVFRFGQLFDFPSAKSFPFRETLSDCKGTKINHILETFCPEIFVKKS
jgi:hypothetical protein